MAPTSENFSPVQLGIVGLGDFGKLHALTAANVLESDLVALVDPNDSAMKILAEQFPETPRWTDLDRALNESETEAWIVSTSTASHVSIAQQLLAAGEKVLLEKPIAMDLHSSQTLSPLVEPDSSNLMMGHLLLFSSEFRQLRVEAENRGQIDYIDCVRHRPATTLERYPGETPFHLTMVHDLYTILALKNRAEPSRLEGRVHFNPHGECDLALARMEWGDGTFASLTASFLTPAGMPADGFDRMEVFGRGWTARLQANPRPIEIWDDQARWPLGLEIQVDQNATTGMLAEQLRCFCRVVRGKETVPMGATYADAIQVQGWLEQLAVS